MRRHECRRGTQECVRHNGARSFLSMGSSMGLSSGRQKQQKNTQGYASCPENFTYFACVTTWEALPLVGLPPAAAMIQIDPERALPAPGITV
jgi:hypothetical protein